MRLELRGATAVLRRLLAASMAVAVGVGPVAAGARTGAGETGGQPAPQPRAARPGLPVLFAASARLSAAPDAALAVPDSKAAAVLATAAPGQAGGGGRRRWIVAAAALVAGGALAAHWSSDRADRAYERYLTSAGPGRRERALDRAEHYDRLAGAGFAAMEVGLAACVYLVLSGGD